MFCQLLLVIMFHNQYSACFIILLLLDTTHRQVLFSVHARKPSKALPWREASLAS